MKNFEIRFKVWDKQENRWMTFPDWRRHDVEFNFDPEKNEIVCEYDESRFEVCQLPCSGAFDIIKTK